MSGKDIILEDLREQCIYNETRSTAKWTLWWDYMEYLQKHCRAKVTEPCSKKAHEMTGLDFKKTMRCVDKSFSDPVTRKGDNPVLEHQYLTWRSAGSHIFPGVIINNSSYRGELSGFYVFETICAGFD